MLALKHVTIYPHLTNKICNFTQFSFIIRKKRKLHQSAQTMQRNYFLLKLMCRKFLSKATQITQTIQQKECLVLSFEGNVLLSIGEEYLLFKSLAAGKITLFCIIIFCLLIIKKGLSIQNSWMAQYWKFNATK